MQRHYTRRSASYDLEHPARPPSSQLPKPTALGEARGLDLEGFFIAPSSRSASPTSSNDISGPPKGRLFPPPLSPFASDGSTVAVDGSTSLPVTPVDRVPITPLRTHLFEDRGFSPEPRFPHPSAAQGRNERRLEQSAKSKEGTISELSAAMDLRPRPAVAALDPRIVSNITAQARKSQDHRRTTSDFSDTHRAKSRTPRKDIPKHQQPPLEIEEEDDRIGDAIEAELIRFQWIHESKRTIGIGIGIGSSSSSGLTLAIPISDTVEMLSSPVPESSRKSTHGRSSSSSRSRRVRSKSSASSLRDVFTDFDVDVDANAAPGGSRSSVVERWQPSSRPLGESRKSNTRSTSAAAVAMPSLGSTDSLDLGMFNFPPPPKTLRERHSHGSLRASAAAGQGMHKLVYPKEPSPPLLPSLPTGPPLSLPARSPLRERRAKPPLHISLADNKTSGTVGTLPFSPPPCPPPSTPLPNLPPTPSSEVGGTVRRSAMHSRKSSVASASTESRRSSNASETHYGAIASSGGCGGGGAKNISAQLRKRSFVRAHSASPSVNKPRVSSGSGGNLNSPPHGGGGRGTFSPNAPSHSYPHSHSHSSRTLAGTGTGTGTGYDHVNSDDFFKMFDDVVPPLFPPPSARNSGQDHSQFPSDKAKLANLVECLSPSMDANDGIFSGMGEMGSSQMVKGERDPVQKSEPMAGLNGGVVHHRLSYPVLDTPLGVEGGDKVIYGLAL